MDWKRYTTDLHLTCSYIFDFEYRTVSTIKSGNGQYKEAGQVVPFSQFDEGTLERMHAKLVELGGKPRSLDGQSVSMIKIAPAGAPKTGTQP